MIAKDLDAAADFPAVSYDEWREAVEADLKGASFDRKLVGRTPEGIAIRPIYTAADRPDGGDPAGFPGFAPKSRGGRPTGHAVDGWDIRQEHSQADPAAANRAILDDLEHGVNSIRLRLDAAASAGLDADDDRAAGLAGIDGVMISSHEDLKRTLKGVTLDAAPISIDAGAAFLPASALLGALLDGRPTRSAFAADPIGALAREGRLGASLESALAALGDLAAWTSQTHPEATAVEVDTGVYHHAGATSAQDLAFAAATGLEYLRAMTAAGLSVDESARQIAFGMSLGTQFFREIAKLRALRKLWTKILIECGGDPDAGRTSRVRATTSRRVLTVVDPWVNLLRNTVCGFAGTVGGADAITTVPFDALIGPSDAAARRLARNTQIILLDESHLNRVIDPAGGSWFIETLTDQLAEKAWEILREIESRGGMAEALQTGWVAEQVAAVDAARQEDIATRKVVVTGVTDHPNVREERPNRPHPDLGKLREEAAARLAAWRRDHPADLPLQALAAVAKDPKRTPGSLTAAAVAAARDGATLGAIAATLSAAGGEPAKATPLPARTDASAFEELRAAADRHAEATGRRPRVFLANLGTPAEFTARSTYAMNFFQAGGFEDVAGEGFADAASAAEAFAKSGAKVAVICSTDKKYEQIAKNVAQALKRAGARTVILAGNPGASEAAHREAGIDRFIFIRCNVLGTLRDLLREEGPLT